MPLKWGIFICVDMLLRGRRPPPSLVDFYRFVFAVLVVDFSEQAE